MSMPDRAPTIEDQRIANRKLTIQLTVFALGALLFGFALVPLYDTICDVVGYGSRRNLTEASIGNESRGIQRDVTVEFVSTMPTVGEWEFKPLQTSMKVRTGQLQEVKFVAKNLLQRPAVAQAIPDIAPRSAALHFRKTECFCFSPQQFDALQERELTVRFFVDSQLPDDIDRITLGYAMFGVPQKVAAR
jgi:cytochrome c oxidase assembly protein subunit 11